MQNVFNKYSNLKDNELIKLVVDRVIDLDEVVKYIPKVAYKKKIEDINLEKKREIIEGICSCISDTRNCLAHAKANYRLKGTECPEDEKDIFVKLLYILARQAIRWFSRQPEETRVL